MKEEIEQLLSKITLSRDGWQENEIKGWGLMEKYSHKSGVIYTRMRDFGFFSLGDLDHTVTEDNSLFIAMKMNVEDPIHEEKCRYLRMTTERQDTVFLSKLKELLG